MAEIIVELSETELDQVVGGVASATTSFINIASGANATVRGIFSQSTTANSTASSVTQSGFLFSST